MCKPLFYSNKIALIAILFFHFVSLSKQNERIVTDLRVIYDKRGVDLDYRYNETHYNSNGLSSVPGCPKSISGLPWIYYGNPKKCYLAHFTGPCSKGEMLLTHEESPYGFCGCECMTLNPDKYISLGENKGIRYLGCKDDEKEISKNFPLGQVFNVNEQRCYGMYTNGPCEKAGEVITEFTEKSIMCKPICNKALPNWTELHSQQMCAVVS